SMIRPPPAATVPPYTTLFRSDRGAGGGLAGRVAPWGPRRVPQPRPAYPESGAQAAHRPGRDGAAGDRAGQGGGTVPGGPPRDPDAPQRREPDRALRLPSRTHLAAPGADDRRDPRGSGGGGGLHPGGAAPGGPGGAGRPRGGRSHPPAGGADRERRLVLAAVRAGQRGRGAGGARVRGGG